MATKVFINPAVKNLDKSRNFFAGLGYRTGICALILLSSSLKSLHGCNHSPSTSENKSIIKNHSTENAADEKVIRQKINEYIAAIRVKDLEKDMQ